MYVRRDYWLSVINVFYSMTTANSHFAATARKEE